MMKGVAAKSMDINKVKECSKAIKDISISKGAKERVQRPGNACGPVNFNICKQYGHREEGYYDVVHC